MKFQDKILIGAGIAVLGGVLLNSCASIPKNATPVSGFEPDRYLGAWYEIARFDYRFEKNLNNVAAHYSRDADGNIRVQNSGYNFKKSKWTKTEGIAKFRHGSDTAALKVSFFGPFYSGYNVIDLDPKYQYALVAGKNLDYLWILSRQKQIPEGIKKQFLAKAQSVGYDTSQLIWVKHDKVNPYVEGK